MIDEMAQNRVKLIAQDLADCVDEERLYSILLNRGVFKWFAIRRELIKLKNKWRDKLTELYGEARAMPQGTERKAHAKTIHTMESCCKEIRALCHSPRLQAPDNDKEAQNFLKELL